jgi:hypothetical protein
VIGRINARAYRGNLLLQTPRYLAGVTAVSHRVNQCAADDNAVSMRRQSLRRGGIFYAEANTKRQTSVLTQLL